MSAPRPTMTIEDMRSLREFFDSPAGAAVMGQIQDSMKAQPITDPQPDSFWRPSPPGSLPYPDGTEDEASAPTPPDPSRTFRPMSLPHRVSWWPIIIAAMVCTTICAGIIGWFVSAALRGRP